MPKDRLASPLQQEGYQGPVSCPKAPSALVLGCILHSESVFGSYFPTEVSYYHNNPPRQDAVELASPHTLEFPFGR